MSEVIQFPNPDETSKEMFSVISESEQEEICNVSNGRIARNIARLLAEDWWGSAFIVMRGDVEVFRVCYTEEDCE